MGPILFIYFINDLPDVIKCACKIFADDTKVYKEINDLSDNLLLQDSIDAMVEWGDKWLSYFNSDKCKVLHMGKDNPKYVYKMKNGDELNNLVVTECEKDLGVFVDSDLSFNEHIQKTTSKAKNMCYLIMRTITYKSPEVMLPLYKALIRPILEYGNPIWCPYKQKDIDDVEAIQRFFTKRIIGMSNLSYEERLIKLRLPSLGFRRLRGDMIEVFKITHNIYDPLTTNKFFKLDLDSKTRTNGFKIVKVRTNTTHFQHFFTNRAVNSWNCLPASVVNVETVNSFKGALDRHFRNIMYKVEVGYK